MITRGFTMKISSYYFVEVRQARTHLLKKLSGDKQCFQRRQRTPAEYSAKARLMLKLVKYENIAHPYRSKWECK